MAFGIVDSGMIPVRRERSERSELLSQFLFGELYEVVEEQEKWLRVRLLSDGYEGWIVREVHHHVNEDYARRYMDTEQLLLDETFFPVRREGDWSSLLLPLGSVLPFYDAYARHFFVGEDTYKGLGNLRASSVDNVRDLLLRYALMYHNTPYLYGGRTPLGIDAAGLTQMVYRLIGIGLPRVLGEQVECGESLSFVEEALPGDLVFFGDSGGALTHVGILWEAGHVIHASGRVRVDRLDNHGIFNEELKRYTHTLKVIKRYI